MSLLFSSNSVRVSVIIRDLEVSATFHGYIASVHASSSILHHPVGHVQSVQLAQRNKPPISETTSSPHFFSGIVE